MTVKNILCLGYGYSANALSFHLLHDHSRVQWNITGTHRSVSQPKKYTYAIDNVSILPINHPYITTLAREAEYILISARPPEASYNYQNYDNNLTDPMLQLFYYHIQNNKRIKWLGYLSTTGVYGNHQGKWVDETTFCFPTSKRGILRLKAEQEWMSMFHDHNIPVHIFRLAGIYGPSRGPIHKLLSGKAIQIIKAEQVFSRIHVDDIANILLLSMLHPNPGSIYNVCDNLPAPPQEVLCFAASLLSLPPPPALIFEDNCHTLPGKIIRFYTDNKRVHNKKLITELSIRLKYKSYIEGLSSIANAMNNT